MPQLKEVINKDRIKEEKLNDHSITGILKRLKIKRVHGREGRYFQLSENQIMRLKSKYCLTDNDIREIENEKPPF